MKKSDIEVGGCCMGIPFGCSSVLLLFVGAAFWLHTGSAWFLLAAIAPPAAAVAAGAFVGTSRVLRKQPFFVPRSG